ncbi:MAG: HEPN domain-containing protein [Deltaproteobacteria bacterium]|nr:HEPN domain-containing protein [Deltaproteobacteria bacterium]
MSRIKLATYRIQKAKEILSEASDCLQHKHYGLSVTRSYYAMFSATRALLAFKEMDSSKHSGVIALFNQHIVKADLFPKDIGKFITKAKDLREEADYGDFVEITEKDAKIQLERAQTFVAEAEKTAESLARTETE